MTQPDAQVVYAPLVAGTDSVGVLVVFGRPGRAIDATHSRTIATVGAQLALTAQAEFGRRSVIQAVIILATNVAFFLAR